MPLKSLRDTTRPLCYNPRIFLTPISSDKLKKKCSNSVATPTTHYENNDTGRIMKRPEKHAEAQHELP